MVGFMCYKTAVRRNSKFYTSEGFCIDPNDKDHEIKVSYKTKNNKNCGDLLVYNSPFDALKNEYSNHIYVLRLLVTAGTNEFATDHTQYTARMIQFQGTMTKNYFERYYKGYLLKLIYDRMEGRFYFENENNYIQSRTYYKAAPFAGKLANICEENKQENNKLQYNYITFLDTGYNNRNVVSNIYSDKYVVKTGCFEHDDVEDKYYSVFIDKNNKSHLICSENTKAYEDKLKHILTLKTDEEKNDAGMVVKEVENMVIWNPERRWDKTMLCKVLHNGKMNYFDLRTRKFILPDWWYSVMYSNGYFKVMDEDLMVNYADLDGKYILDEKIDNGSPVDAYGSITIIKDGKKTKRYIDGKKL